jgi:hypothetical protein
LTVFGPDLEATDSGKHGGPFKLRAWRRHECASSGQLAANQTSSMPST